MNRPSSEIERERNEVTRQFDEIFAEHHDPLLREEKQCRENRERREREKKADGGL